MPPEPARTPLALAAREVDLARNARPVLQLARKFMTRSTRKSVISALQFKIGRADSRPKHSNPRASFGNARQRLLPDLNFTPLKMNR
jgi:hypothetical protein